MGQDLQQPIEIVRLVDAAPPGGRPVLLGAIERIFFASSPTQQFAGPAARASFRETWLDRYLGADAEHAFLARVRSGPVVAYVIGALDDPAMAARFADVGYFQLLAAWTRQYPAHLHINVDEAYRSRGIGERLIERFCAHAAARGAPGVHVVTAKGARNVGFYSRCGFRELAAIEWHDRPIVMLGRALLAAAPS